MAGVAEIDEMGIDQSCGAMEGKAVWVQAQPLCGL